MKKNNHLMKNVVWQKSKVSQEDRSNLLGYPNKVLWFTGLPSSGKTTLAREVEKKLHDQGILTYLLDGDNIRHGLNKDLTFSKEDRDENIRRATEVTKLFHDAGLTILISFISPYQEMRNRARHLIGKDFIEIFVNCPLEECERRDVKGMYQKARRGEIKDFTGISDSYEKPVAPEIIINSDQESLQESVKKIIDYLSSSN